MHVRDDEAALKSHHFSLVGMMRRAVNRKALQAEWLPSLHEWIHVGNSIVHSRGNVVISQKLAKSIVHGIIKVMDSFPPR
jgi:hypothetical protein